METQMNDQEIQRAQYPRVSDIISKQNEMELKSVPIRVLADACIRGTRVHELCTTFIKNLWVLDIEPEYAPYFESFKEWAQKNIEYTLFSPIRLYDDSKRFTGECDMIVKLRSSGEIALVDIKTSSAKSKAWPIQLAAYHHLCKLNGYDIDKICNVHLKPTKAAIYEQKDGQKVLISAPIVKARVIEYEDINPYWEIFSSSLKCYDYFDRKEPK